MASSSLSSARLSLTSYQTIEGPQSVLFSPSTNSGRMNESSPVFYRLQDFVPFGAAALLPLTPIHNHLKQGNGYRWPHIALGRPVFVCLFVIIVDFKCNINSLNILILPLCSVHECDGLNYWRGWSRILGHQISTQARSESEYRMFIVFTSFWACCR